MSPGCQVNCRCTCNIHKSNKNVINWLGHPDREPYFGNLFLSSLKAEGGDYTGIVKTMVCKDRLQNEKKQQLDQFVYEFYHDELGNNKGIGTGEFIRNWLYTEQREAIEVRKAEFKNIKTPLHKMLKQALQLKAKAAEFKSQSMEFMETGNFTEAQKTLDKSNELLTNSKKLIATLNKKILSSTGVSKAIDNHYHNIGSEKTPSDKCAEGTKRISMNRQYGEGASLFMHWYKIYERYIDSILDITDKENYDALKARFYAKIRSQLPSVMIEFYHEFVTKIEELKGNQAKLKIRTLELEEKINAIYITKEEKNIKVVEWLQTTTKLDETTTKLDETTTKLDIERLTNQENETRWNIREEENNSRNMLVYGFQQKMIKLLHGSYQTRKRPRDDDSTDSTGQRDNPEKPRP